MFLANLAIIIGIIVATLHLNELKKTTIATQDTAKATYETVEATYKSIKNDHERRQKQSTIDFFHRVHVDSGGYLNSKFFEINKPLSYEIFKAKDADEKDSIMNFLTGLENLAIGVNTGIFNIDVCYHLCGTHMIAIYESLSDVIDNIRHQTKSQKTFSDSEHMIEELKKMRDIAKKEEAAKKEEQIKNISLNA